MIIIIIIIMIIIVIIIIILVIITMTMIIINLPARERAQQGLCHQERVRMRRWVEGLLNQW